MHRQVLTVFRHGDERNKTKTKLYMQKGKKKNVSGKITCDKYVLETAVLRNMLVKVI